MSAEGKQIVVGVFCADWRLHQQSVNVVNMLKEQLGVDGVDVLAVAGPEGVIMDPVRAGEKEGLKNNLNVLIGAHKPAMLAFVAHQQCAGYPASDEKHEQAIAQTAQEFKMLTNFAGPVVALVATYAADDKWGLKEVARV